MTRARDNSNILGTSGTNGQVLTIDTAQNNGYAFENPAQYAAGKNKVINGDFNIAQRGTSFTPAASAEVYNLDRWLTSQNGTGATITVTQQAFTVGAAPVAGYESAYYLQFNQSVAGSGQAWNQVLQKIESSRTFANKTVTASFWAKADTARTLTLTLRQNFGSGGSSYVDTTSGTINISTSWARYSVTLTLPSISGSTIGTGDFLGFIFNIPLNTVQTFSFWGVQLEAGSVATPFTTATGTLQGELAACQRYYWLTGKIGYMPLMLMTALNSSLLVGNIQFPVTMRTTPSFTAGGTATSYSLFLDVGSGNQAQMLANTSGLTTNYSYRNFNGGGDGTSYWAFSAEL